MKPWHDGLKTGTANVLLNADFKSKKAVLAELRAGTLLNTVNTKGGGGLGQAGINSICDWLEIPRRPLKPASYRVIQSAITLLKKNGVTPDDVIPAMPAVCAAGQANFCEALLYLWGFVTDAERRKIKARIGKWERAGSLQKLLSRRTENQ